MSPLLLPPLLLHLCCSTFAAPHLCCSRRCLRPFKLVHYRNFIENGWIPPQSGEDSGCLREAAAVSARQRLSSRDSGYLREAAAILARQRLSSRGSGYLREAAAVFARQRLSWRDHGCLREITAVFARSRPSSRDDSGARPNL